MKRAQLESSGLRVQLEEAQLQIVQLRQDLEAIEANKDTQQPRTRSSGIVDEVRLALRKFAALYDPFPPLDKDFYEQEQPEDNGYATDYHLRYESDASMSLGTLLELYSVFPEEHASDIVLAKESFLKMICVVI